MSVDHWEEVAAIIGTVWPECGHSEASVRPTAARIRLPVPTQGAVGEPIQWVFLDAISHHAVSTVQPFAEGLRSVGERGDNIVGMGAAQGLLLPLNSIINRVGQFTFLMTIETIHSKQSSLLPTLAQLLL